MIEILGTLYKVVIDNQYLKEKDILGEIDFIEKIIYLTDKKEALLHEIIHAYLYESGLQEWAEDERLVTWIEIQFNKILYSKEKYETNSN